MSVKELESEFADLASRNLALNLTRGKPSAAQVSLADGLDGILQGDYLCANGLDSRNYGELRGVPECRELGTYLTDYPVELVLAGSNSSLQLMYFVVDNIVHYGLAGSRRLAGSSAKALCPVPGYDRHFALTEFFWCRHALC